MPRTVTPVTVVISTLARPHLLRRCLVALLTGEVLPDEVVVVDQGDRASTAAVLDELACQLPVRHLAQERLGLSASQNAGVKAARSSIVAVVDDDCVPAHDWLAVIRREFGERPGPLLVTGRVLALPAEGQRTRAVSSRTSTVRQVWDGPTLPWQVGTGGNFAVTRDAYLAVGGNDERLGTGTPGRGGNDLDLFHRLLRSGVTALYEPDLVVRHERSTEAEHRARRGSYGFGVGAAVGRWFRQGDRRAVGILLGWLRLRASMTWQHRSRSRLRDEALVLGGTLAGLAHGLRLPSQRAEGSTG